MSARWLPLAVFTFLGAVAAGFAEEVQVGHKEHAGPACAADCGCGDRTIHATKVLLVEKQETCAKPVLNIREVSMIVPTMSMAVDYKEEKRCVTVLVAKPREVEQTISSVTCVPETTVDPCTGCSHTTYKQVPFCKTVKVTVYDQVEEKKEVIVKVPVLKPVETQVGIKYLTADWTTQAVTYNRLDAVVTPMEIKFPCAPPVPPPPPSCCPEPSCHAH